MAYYLDYDFLIIFICGFTIGFIIGFAINHAINSLLEYKKRLIERQVKNNTQTIYPNVKVIDNDKDGGDKQDVDKN